MVQYFLKLPQLKPMGFLGTKGVNIKAYYYLLELFPRIITIKSML